MRNIIKLVLKLRIRRDQCNIRGKGDSNKHFEHGKTYVFFSHVVKGQSYNMPMLKALMDKGCTLIDYERIVDDMNRRIIFFGRFAGLAGMINTLWAIGLRLKSIISKLHS